MNKNQRFILITFLLGVFIGAIDAGIVAPALTTIVGDFNGIDIKWSVWVVTVYTLVYAVSMPIVGKLADIYGRQRLFLIGITLFGLGSLLAGLSNSFYFLLAARALQALGGGGIMPIANAVIGQSFPREKRGMALGLVGAVFGVATIIAPNLGGFIVDKLSWRWIFFINVPLVFMIIFMALKIPNQVDETNKRLDWKGSVVLSFIILSLMYGLTNLETNNFLNSVLGTAVWPFILLSILLIFPFVYIEKRAINPVIKLSYFSNKNIVLALIVSFITGIGMISMIFVPSFSETLLRLSEGKGGYVMTVLAVASGVSAGLGGVLLDKWGAKKVVLLGFLLSLGGSAILAFITTGWAALIVGLIISGFGIGFTMGAPLNYIILELTPEKESSVALSLVSLFRSIGTTIGPIILAGFISGAAAKIPENIQGDLDEKFAGFMPDTNMTGSLTATETGNFSVPAMLEHLPVQVPEGIRQQIHEVVNISVQNTMLSGYQKLYIGAMIIFLAGILFAYFLKLPKKVNQ